MASNVSKTHFLRSLNKRRYATAAAKYAGAYSNDVKIKTLPNKLVVASAGSSLPISRLSVTIKAGSRYDPSDQPGLNNVLRSSAGLTTSGASTFAIIRNVQQIGGSISCTGARDNITYTLEATCDQIDKGFPFLKDVISNQVFKPWELEDNIPRIQYELAVLPPEAKLVDLLHKVAYRNGLGNPLYVKKFNIPKIGTETLQHFVSSTFTNSRTAVVGVGVSHDLVNSFAEDLDLESASGPEINSSYYGGEIFEEKPISFTYTGIVVEAPGLNDKNALAFAVLRYALGGWSNIKYTSGNSPLVKAVDDKNEPVAVSAFNAVHSDSGLFGVIVSAPSAEAKATLISAAKVLQSGKVPSDAVKRAKNQLKNDIFIASQKGEEVTADIANQVLFSGSYTGPADVAAAVDKISDSDVSAALSKFNSGKKSLATYGNLSNIPYLDEFK